MILSLVIAILGAFQSLTVLKLIHENRDLTRLLASRNFNEYSIGEARLKGNVKTNPDYESVWEENDANHK